MKPPKPTVILAVLLLVALGVRLGWGLTRPSDVESLRGLPDQVEYLEVGRNLLAGKGLSFYDPRFQQTVYAYRTPGYPLLVAGMGGNPTAIRVAQAVIDASTVLAAYLLARRWLTAWPSLFAAALVAFNPFLVYFSGLILTETLFTALLTWGMVLLTARGTLLWLCGGLLLATSALVRPGAIGLPVLLGVLGALAMQANRGDGPAYQRTWPLPYGTTMLVLTVLVLFPWAFRNHQRLGHWIWTSTNSGITRYDGFNPDAAAKRYPQLGESDQSFLNAMPHVGRMSETERNDYFAGLANDFARERPFDALRLTGGKVLRTWSPRPLSEGFSRPVYVVAAMVYSVPLMVLFLAGLAFAPLPGAGKWFLTAPAIYFTLTVIASVGSLRYRLPAEVPMAVIAAGAVASLGSRRIARPDDEG